MSKIYTKKGDTGFTSTLTQSGIKKDNDLFDILGSIDSLNVAIGALDTDYTYHKDLQRILIYISGILQQPNIDSYELDTDAVLSEMEQKIDDITETLPKLTKFLLIGNEDFEIKSHNCRLITREVERKLVGRDNIHLDILKFFNRLSDYFYTLARVYSSEQSEYRGIPKRYKKDV